jgi:hypothetical protein
LIVHYSLIGYYLPNRWASDKWQEFPIVPKHAVTFLGVHFYLFFADGNKLNAIPPPCRGGAQTIGQRSLTKWFVSRIMHDPRHGAAAVLGFPHADNYDCVGGWLTSSRGIPRFCIYGQDDRKSRGHVGFDQPMYHATAL